MSRPIRVALLFAALLHVFSTGASAQPRVPADVGTAVNGYQDDFDGSSLAGGWQVLGANVYSVSNGALHVTTASGDPNHLLYAVAGYDNSVQEVLARIRVLSFGAGDLVRGGVGVGVDPTSTQGINYLFRDNTSDGQTSYHLAFLNDLIAWGPVQNFIWQPNTWYWIRLRQEPNTASLGGVNDVFGKIWLADGSQAEPANWQLTWDYTPGQAQRTGFAGITASSGGAFQFDVDYILIKASGLPSITVAPAAFPLTQTPVTITNQPQSQIVVELQPTTFSVGASGNPAPTFQWYKNNLPIAGATSATYSIASAQLSDNGTLFKVLAANVASNVSYSATSIVATLTVNADTNPPVLLMAQALGLSQVRAIFSERITPATATNVANYAITGANGGLPISSVTLDPSQTNLTLNVSPLTEGVVYTLTVNGLTDQSAAANLIASNSQATFLAASYEPQDIGSPTPAGGAIPVPGGYNVSGGGANIGGTSDQCQFDYQLRSGDFDFRVRLDSLSLADAWSEAGLVAREDLTPGARSAGVLATPTISGAFFQSRSAVNGPTTLSGSFPINYPSMWLRLNRAGNVFTGFAGFDGLNWTQLGTVSIALPASIYFGFAVSSHNTNQLATAAFRDFSAVTAAGANAPLAMETLGQSSRRASLVISEIMYHRGKARGTMNTNAQGFVTNSLEFVEIFNARGEPQDMSGYQLGGSISYTFPAGTLIPGGGFLVVAKSPADIESVYGISGVLGPFANNLPNGNGTAVLLNQAGGVFLEVKYGTTPPWPAAADGGGHSLVLARPSYGENNPLAWAASDAVAGSPGKLDPVTPDPLRNVVINEFLAHGDPPLVEFIELYNHGGLALDVSGCSLSDDPETNKFLLPPGTTIPARGFLSYDQTQLGFSLTASGESIYFRNAAGNRVLDAVRYPDQQNGVSFGRAPDGASAFHPLAARTPGTTNSAPRQSDIVINEIMYAPVSLNPDDQYVELYNQGANAVNLGGWKFISGISYTFPSNTMIAPDGYLVVARNASRMLTNYGNLNAGNLVGDFGGSLAGRGERLALTMPDLVIATNSQGQLATNVVYPVVNEVTYGTGGRWGQWSHGGGSSLELIDPRADNSLAPNWADSDETHKAPWTIISATGTIDNGNVPADELQVLLQGVGECLVDNVQVLNASSNNLIANSSFESGASGWTAEGTESSSSLESSEGYLSSKSYHLRAVEKGDNQVNRVRTLLTAPLAAGATNVTIRAAVRWLKGDPEVLLRLRGNWLECAGELALPVAPGTPGARNSRYATNAPPAIVDVKHSPVLPSANQPIVVTARVNDPDGISSVMLKYRLDPNATYSAVTMTDNGAGGDAVAGDGIFSATIPGQAAGALVAFYVQAADNFVLPATAAFPNDAPARECLVRVGEAQPTGNYPIYRVWMTQAMLNAWNSTSRLNNTSYDVTFVLGNERVIYNTEGRFKGSPYISPGYCGATCGRCGYAITFPADDLFLGEQDLVLDWPGGHGGETTALQEQMGYWIADRLNLPFSHRYTIRLHVNGVTDDARQAVFEAVMQPAAGFEKEWVPNDSNGDFFKVERAFEFNDADGLVADPEPRLQHYTTTGGVKKRERYRWNWLFRATDRRDNYTNIFALVDAVNATAPEPYTTATTGRVDIEEWMGIFATEHIIVNFDAYGHEIGKNMYAFLPDHGKWQLYMFDLDWLMLAAPRYNANYAASSAPLFNADDPTITRMYSHPPFVRAYWRAIQSAVDGPLDPANCNPVIDAKSRSLFANGIAWCDGQALTDPTVVKTWFSQRRAFLQAQLATVAAPFGVNSLVVVSNDLGYVSGTAPVGVKTVLFNGVEWPVTWTSVTGWTVGVPLLPGTNAFSVVGVDVRGQPIAGASNNVSAVYNGTVPSPAGQVVINEIMYNPLVPNGEYVELYNSSTKFTFDLSGWQFRGLSYTFPVGSLIRANSFLVLAASRAAFPVAYGATIPVFDTFGGTLQLDGETLSLLRPGTNGDLVVAQVRYENGPPWPTGPNGTGSSLQLIDPLQDNWRAGNWTGTFPPASLSPGAPNAVSATLPGFPPLWLNELQADNLTGITNRAGQRTAWLELHNPSTNVVSLSGLYLANNYGNLTSWPFPIGAVINPGEFKVIFADGQTDLSTLTELHAGFILPGGTGALALSRLYNGQPQVLDYLNYIDLGPNHSYGSFPDGQSFDRREFYYATPGGTNNGASAPLVVFINEWMASNTHTLANTNHNNAYDDWFELYNPGLSYQDLASYYLTDNLANQFQFRVPPGYRVPPHGFLLVWADNAPGLNSPDSADLHVNFQLAKSGEAIGLFAADGTRIDAVTFGPQTNDVSMGRYPDGGPNLYFMPTPTPRGANVLPVSNTPPILAPIGSQTVHEGQTVTFTATATDADMPAQTLTFSLDPGAPAGAVIDGSSGVFTWSTIGIAAPSTNTVTVRVTDDGLPPLSESETIALIVIGPPSLSVVSRSGDQLTLGWTTIPARTYRVEYTDELDPANWQPLGSDMPASSGGLSISVSVSAPPQRFFRIVVVQ